MKISAKGRYALLMFLDLAQQKNNGYIALKDIANRQGISKKYLEQIVPLVNKPDFLQANRDFQGGYKLAKSPDSYTVGDILRITEGSLSPVPYLDREDATLPVWQGLDHVINEYLDSITLQEILDMQQDRYAYDYVI